MSDDEAVPALTVGLHETMKLGWDNPDNIHHDVYVSEVFEYRLFGRRGEAHTVTFAIYGGSYGKGEQGRDTVAFVELDDFDDPADVLGSADRASRRVPHRENRCDRPAAAPRSGDGRSRPAPHDALSPRQQQALLRLLGFVLREVCESLRGQRSGGHAPNQGIPFNQMSSGWWRIEEDEAAIIDFRPPPECPYWMFVVSNHWGESFDYRHHPIHTNARRTTRRPDGSVRLVVAHRDPKLDGVQWISTAGHSDGVWQFRWYKPDGPPPCPEPRIVKAAELAG